MHDVFIDEDSPTSSKSESETDCDIVMASEVATAAASGVVVSAGEESRAPSQQSGSFPTPWGGERRRRKLPEIPKNKKCMYDHKMQYNAKNIQHNPNNL